ncbi:MAG: glycosyltransferase family 4 protein [Candidatus Paceibacterota bacterium]
MTSSLKIKLLLKLENGPFGGGNQFLKALKKELEKKDVVFVENREEANVLFTVTYHNLLEAVKLKRLFPEKKLIFRLGDVFRYHRGPRWKFMDKAIALSASFADGAIFQSNWSFEEAKKIGFNNKNSVVIYNAVDSSIFNSKNRISRSGKIKLIAASWSSNKNKGFSFYEFLDNHLDFDKFEMTFIGNSPVEFKNIIKLPPIPSVEIAEHFKKSDIFISASKLEACSNSILEAMSSGLPVIALNSGSNPEIIRKGSGELFDSEFGLLSKINQVSSSLENYKNNNQENIENIAQKYLDFINRSPVKKISLFSFLKIKFFLKLFNLSK